MVKTQTKLSQDSVLAVSLDQTQTQLRAERVDFGVQPRRFGPTNSTPVERGEGWGELKRADKRNGMAWGRGRGSSERWVGPYPGFGDMW